MVDNHTYTVEAGIPIPQRRAGTPVGHTYGSKYPFDEMEVGDSILFPGKQARHMGSILNTANSWCVHRNYEWMFCTRLMEDGVRLWRTH